MSLTEKFGLKGNRHGQLLVFGLTVAVLGAGAFGATQYQRAQALEAELASVTDRAAGLVVEVDRLTAEVNRYVGAIQEKDEAIAELEAALGQQQEEETPVRGADLGVFEATAYGGGGLCADGHPAEPGVLAADPRVLPYGTRVYVEFEGVPQYNGVYTVHDCGSAVKGKIIDVYMDGGWNQFGRRNCRVYLVN